MKYNLDNIKGVSHILEKIQLDRYATESPLCGNDSTFNAYIDVRKDRGKNMIVTMVNTIIVLPCLAVSADCLRASTASNIFAFFCLRSRR
jgi:hypothetical protein